MGLDVTSNQGDGGRSRSYVIERNFKETTKNATNFCAFESTPPSELQEFFIPPLFPLPRARARNCWLGTRFLRSEILYIFDLLRAVGALAVASFLHYSLSWLITHTNLQFPHKIKSNCGVWNTYKHLINKRFWLSPSSYNILFFMLKLHSFQALHEKAHIFFFKLSRFFHDRKFFHPKFVSLINTVQSYVFLFWWK